jgi:hypothetical protein
VPPANFVEPIDAAVVPPRPPVFPALAEPPAARMVVDDENHVAPPDVPLLVVEVGPPAPMR